LEIELPIGAKNQSMNIEVQAKVGYLNYIEVDSKRTWQSNVTSKHTIRFWNGKGEDLYFILIMNLDRFCSLFLRYSDEGYQLYLLGKNGEPKLKVVI
jgi:hypothetical protein